MTERDQKILDTYARLKAAVAGVLVGVLINGLCSLMLLRGHIR
jgi:hypothetical protein